MHIQLYPATNDVPKLLLAKEKTDVFGRLTERHTILDFPSNAHSNSIKLFFTKHGPYAKQ